MKNHQRELASTRVSLFLRCTAPPRLSHPWFKIIQPVSVRCRGIYKGALLFFFFLSLIHEAPVTMQQGFHPCLLNHGDANHLQVNHSCWWSWSMFSLSVQTPYVNIYYKSCMIHHSFYSHNWNMKWIGKSVYSLSFRSKKANAQFKVRERKRV